MYVRAQPARYSVSVPPVRNIMAILFLVGARLEAPCVIEELMNTEKGKIAADRVKMRLAAKGALRATANSTS